MSQESEARAAAQAMAARKKLKPATVPAKIDPAAIRLKVQKVLLGKPPPAK